MSLLNVLAGKVWRLFRREVLRDRFLLEVKRWFADDGDQRLRFDYPLIASSCVVDLGGYKGDFAAEIVEQFACNVFVYEPVPAFFLECQQRFRSQEAVRLFMYGMSEKAGSFSISNAGDASSFVREDQSGGMQTAELKSVQEAWDEAGLDFVDLMKLNIEGGEFDVLPALIASGLVARVGYIQVQFHNFVEGAVEKRESIRKALSVTHTQMWNYDFVWESWKLKA
jgi:FkbM family methyltransferase